MLSKFVNQKFSLTFLAFAATTFLFQTAQADKVRILNNPVEAAQARIDIIQQAKTSIHAQYYEVEDDNFAHLILGLLRQAALGSPGRQPVEVKLIVDSLASTMSPVLAKALVDANVQIRIYHPFTLLRLSRSLKRMHDKDIIVDGHKLLTGGRNIAKYYYEVDGKPFIDRDIYAEGESAAQAAGDYFTTLWDSKEVVPFKIAEMPKNVKSIQECRQINDQQDNMQCVRDSKLARAIEEAPSSLDAALTLPLNNLPVKLNTNNNWVDGRNDVPVTFIHDTPGKKGIGRGIYDEITEILKTADDSIVIENPYLFPSDEMMAVLKSLTDPNRPSLNPARPPHAVKIRILTNSLVSGSRGMLPQMGYESIKQKLLDMHIDLWETKSTFIHAKSFAIDDRISIIGSFNTDVRSQKLNSEVAMVIYDEQVNQELRASMESHLPEAYQLDPIGYPLDDDHRHPGANHWLIGKLHFFKLLLPFFKPEI